MAKPKLTAAEVQMLVEVERNLINHGITPHRQAFSDCHDGGLYPHEVSGLVRKRLLTRVRYNDGAIMGNGLLGDTESVDFTDRAMRIFWPATVNT